MKNLLLLFFKNYNVSNKKLNYINVKIKTRKTHKIHNSDGFENLSI